MKTSRYFSVLILLAVLSLLFAAAGRAENNAPDEFCAQADYKFTPQELKSLELIKKAKEFEKKLGYKEIQSFKRFDGGVKHTCIWYQLKTEIPFSYIDYRFLNTYKNQSRAESSELAWLVSRRVTRENYDIHIWHPEALANKNVADIPLAVLRAEPLRLAYLVFHEDWHNNVDLPLHFEEASGNLIGYIAAMKFLGRGEKDISSMIEKNSRLAEAINRCHDEISKLAVQLKNGKIGRQEYMSKRQQYIAIVEKDQDFYSDLNAVRISGLHTYYYYWPLALRLYRALDCDLVHFIQVLKEVNEHEEMREPSWPKIIKEADKLEGISGSTWLKLVKIGYFVKTRIAERKIEVYLENVIQKVLAEKSKKTAN